MFIQTSIVICGALWGPGWCTQNDQNVVIAVFHTFHLQWSPSYLVGGWHVISADGDVIFTLHEISMRTSKEN